MATSRRSPFRVTVMVWTPAAFGFEKDTPRSTSEIASPLLSPRNQYVTAFVFATEGTPLAKTGRLPGAVSPFTFITSTVFPLRARKA